MDKTKTLVIWSHENMPQFSQADVVLVRHPQSDWNGCDEYRPNPDGIHWQHMGRTIPLKQAIELSKEVA